MQVAVAAARLCGTGFRWGDGRKGCVEEEFLSNCRVNFRVQACRAGDLIKGSI
jgi:hypothetical protein